MDQCLGSLSSPGISADESESVTQSCPTLCDPVLYRLLYPWNYPGENTGVGSHSFLQGLLPPQGSDPRLLRCRWIFCHVSRHGSSFLLMPLIIFLTFIHLLWELILNLSFAWIIQCH